MIYFLTSGEYSDYSVDGIYEGPPGLNLAAIVQKFASENARMVEDEDGYLGESGDDRWEAWKKFLLDQGGLTKVECEEVHIGGYGRLPS